MPEKRKNAQNDKKRLEKIGNALDYHVTISIKEHFNKVGKMDQFVKTVTPEEIAEQKAAMRGMFYMTEDQMTLATLKTTDIFMRAARRVATDDKELAAFLPAGKFEREDVEILKKNGLKSLSAVVKAHLAP